MAAEGEDVVEVVSFAAGSAVVENRGALLAGMVVAAETAAAAVAAEFVAETPAAAVLALWSPVSLSLYFAGEKCCEWTAPAWNP